MKIWITRHGQTKYNKMKLMQGRTDEPLNETGIAQAKAARERIGDVHFDAVYARPLDRAIVTGAIIGGIGFAIYIALSALEWRGLALFAALAFGLEAGYAFLSALDCREKDKDSVSYNIVWGTGALAILMLLPAVMTIIKG